MYFLETPATLVALAAEEAILRAAPGTREEKRIIVGIIGFEFFYGRKLK